MSRPRSRPSAVSLMEHLQRDATADRLLPTAQRFLEIQHQLNQMLPNVLSGSARVCQFQDGELVVAVPTAAIATKLRQALPRLTSGLSGRGWKVSSILVRLQPEAFHDKSDTYAGNSRQRVVSAQVVAHWQQLSDTLTESNLATSVARLLRHLRAARD